MHPVHKLIVDAIAIADSVREYPEILNTVGMQHWLAECRTIRLWLPRQSGKTTGLNEFACEHSCFQIQRSTSVHNVITMFRGRNMRGMKYQYIIIDDVASLQHGDTNTVVEIVKFLFHNSLLTKDFKIIRIG